MYTYAMDLSATQSNSNQTGKPTPPVLEHVEIWLAKPWVPIAINITALVLLMLSLAQWTWQLMQPPAATVNLEQAAEVRAEGDYQLPALLAANFFGAAEPIANDPALESIPLSSLNLTLTGVMVTPTGSFAFISADGAPEQPIGVGEDIVAGAQLHEVYADRVLIRRGGMTESLMLKESGAALPGDAITETARSAPRAGANTNVDVQRRGNTFNLERNQLNQQMQRPEFLSQALMVPNAGGGFLVREIQPGSVYEKLGLKVGDVINSVNGQSVNTVEDVMKIYQQLGANAAQVNLEVKRAGKTESLHYNIQ